MAEGTVAFEADDGDTREQSGAGNASRGTKRFDDCVFRICSRLNYRAQTELNKTNKAVRLSPDPEETKVELGLEQARVRAHNEAAQNEEALGKLRSGVGFAIKYGDVVQLEHRKSQLFVAMHKTPAPVNSNCRKVSFKPGSYASHFRILPRFKVRSIGSLVYANDEIVFQSVKFDPMVLGGSSSPQDLLPAPDVLPPELGVRLPAALRHGPSYEVNGSIELRSFTVKMYARIGEEDKGNLATSLHRFRLFHPEGNAFVSASADPDKGEVLDARDPAKQARTRPLPELSSHGNPVHSVPAHIPYLKTLSGDVSNPANFSAKAAWRFEGIDPTKAGMVKWRTPLRIRHVPSDKYLSVDSLNPTKVVTPLVRRRRGRRSPGLQGSGDGDGAEGENAASATLYNAALVSGVEEGVEEGAFGSPSSLVFYLVPTDVTGDTLKHGVSTMRIEHRTAAGFTVHFMSPREPKPVLTPLSATDDENPDGSGAGGDGVKEVKADPSTGQGGGATVRRKLKALALEKKGGRLLFSTQSSSVDVLKLLPLTPLEGKRIDTLCSRLRLFRLYAHRYQHFSPHGAPAQTLARGLSGGGCHSSPGESFSSSNGGTSGAAFGSEGSGLVGPGSGGGGSSGVGRELRPPTALCEAVVKQCLGLIDDLRKGEPSPPRHANVADYMKEANTTLPAKFANFFTGEPDTRMQRVAVEVKVLDAVFEAALAPYNRALNSARPFQLPPANDQPRALAKFLYVALQRGVWGNAAAQEYFAGRSSRKWDLPTQASSGVGAVAAAASGNGGSDVSESPTSTETDAGPNTLKVDTSDSVAAPPPAVDVAPPLAPALRQWTPWRDIIISQGEDSLGATVTLGLLLGASENIVAKLVNNAFMARFKSLIKKCGPEPRLINLFASICTVAGKPSRANQEICVRTLWMNLPDRYGVGLTFHEVDHAPGSVTLSTTGQTWPPPPIKRAPDNAPKDFLGKTKQNEYSAVCVAWAGADEWVGDCGKLFWSAKALNVPVVGELGTSPVQEPPKGGVGKLELVPLEHLMWVLEPERLCKEVTGEPWAPLDESRTGGGGMPITPKTPASSSASGSRSRSGPKLMTKGRLFHASADEDDDLEKRRAVFIKQAQLAGYVVAQVNLLTQMCKGRSVNAIAWLEKSFSYECLLNMSSNPRLPFVFRSSVLYFTQALYVNRFPQVEHSGAPCLPEHLWIYHEAPYEGPRKSTTPVLQPLTLKSEAAFPYFFVPPLSSVARDPNPLLSFSSHFKFFLLRSLTNKIVSSFGESGRMVHSLAAFNDLGAAALRGQQGLLDFGFQSTYVKLKDLCEVNAKLLDGRSDLEKPGVLFDPAELRFRENGASAVVTKMKREVIELFIDVGNLRANYRLAKFLNVFKTHSETVSVDETSTPAVSKGEGVGYLLGRSEADVKALYDDFEAMFPGGSDDAAKLDISVLGNKPDLDQALVDCLMYEDDSLMEAALALLDRTYGQRRMLRHALQAATLLPDVTIPVFGDVHSLRSCLNDLLFQARTTSSWGVKSRISGPFGDAEFGAMMSNVDKLLVFLHTPEPNEEDEDDGGGGGGSGGVEAERPMEDKVEPPPRTRRNSGGGISGAAAVAPESDSPGGGLAKRLSATYGQMLAVCRERTSSREKSMDAAEIERLNFEDPGEYVQDPANYQGYFKETDLQGNTYECKGLWSLDVAAKWGNKNRSNQHHQTILRACNLQAVLAEGMVVDNEIAWKGSICTEREKQESERRLTLAKRALLHLATAFVAGNPGNQEVLFPYMKTLQALATPPEFQDGGAGAPLGLAGLSRANSIMAASSGHAKIQPSSGGSGESGAIRGDVRSGSCDADVGDPPPSPQPLFAWSESDMCAGSAGCWPFTVAELAQDLITRILRNNEDLCDRVKRPLIELFASLVDGSPDCSSAPTLDLLFILSQPQELPIQENQTAVAEIMLNQASFPNVANAVCHVLSPGGGGLENPARLVRLLKTVMLNKNEHAASQLMQHANVSIDATCQALVVLVDAAVLKAEAASSSSTGDSAVASRRGKPPLSVRTSWSGAPSEEHGGVSLAASATKSVLCEDSLGVNLLSLLAEQVFLLPMNAVQVMSDAMWQFLSGPAALTLEAFTEVKRMGAEELNCVEDLFDIVEHVFTVLQRLGLMEDVVSDPEKAAVVSNITDDLQVIFNSREMTDDTLRHAFVDALVRSGQKVGLDRERFKRLVLDLDATKNDNLSIGLSDSGLDGEIEPTYEVGKKTAPPPLASPGTGSRKSAKVFPVGFPMRLGSTGSAKPPQSPVQKQASSRSLTKREKEVEEAFDLADDDGNGMVDLYEFVELYAKLSKKKTEKKMGMVASFMESSGGGGRKKEEEKEEEEEEDDDDAKSASSGHALSMRTVECGERILAICRAPKTQLLQAAHFSRADKFPPRQNKGGKRQKLFEPPPATIVPAPGSGGDNVESDPPLTTITERLDAFKKTVMTNPRILLALQRRRFTMVTVLENGAPAPPAKFGRALTYPSPDTKELVENPLCAAVAIGWPDVTKRFVAYCTEHFYDDDSLNGGGSRRTVRLILETWMAHLVKARTLALEEDGVTPAESIPKAAVLKQVTPQELSEEKYADYLSKQQELNNLGVTELLTKVISSLDDVTSGGLPDIALELFTELLNGGYMEGADTLYHHLVRVDTEGKFLKHLDARLDLGLEGIRDAKKRSGVSGGGGGDGTAISDDMEASCDSIIATTRFMQLMCEGHNMKFQNLLRVQPMYSGQFNLVKKVVEILVLLCESSVAVGFFQGIELDVVSQLLALLIELMQGPCSGNQEEIVNSDAIVVANNIIPSKNAYDLEISLANPGHMDIRGQACVLLAACLEGREDMDCHKAITRILEVGALFGYQDVVETEIRTIRSRALGRLLNPVELQKLATLQASLVAVVTVSMELRQEKKNIEKEEAALAASSPGSSKDGDMTDPDDEEGAVGDDGSLEAGMEEKTTKELERLHSQALVGIVEVAWRGQIERNVFAMPFDVEYLTPGTKAKFLEEVDLSTAEKRMSELMHSSEAFIAEMILIHGKAEQSPLFRALNHQMPTFKNYLYGMVMLLNLNVIMSPNKMESPARALVQYLDGDLDLSGLEMVSLGLTIILFLIVLAGYFVIMGHLATVEVPMVILELEDSWGEVEESENPLNSGAWATFVSAVAVAIIFIFLHLINYAPVPGWYLTIALLLIPVLVYSYREAIVRPTSRFQRQFCICYNTVVFRSFLRNHSVLAICSVLGMYDVEFFTLELLDVVNISPVIGDIIKSVTAPGKALLYTLYLFVITSVIYASFGMAYFPEQLQVPRYVPNDTEERRLVGEGFAGDDVWESDEGHFDGPDFGVVNRLLKAKAKKSTDGDSLSEEVQCHSLFHCTVFLFYQGLSEGGNMKGTLRVSSPGTYNYIPRIIYDSVYFIWVGIVLMNIITGLMVDTFSAIRGEKEERAEILETDCFVCGMQRGYYDELGLKPGSPTFSQHLSRDHDLWTYVYFVAYLKRKDPTEYNGIESYVRKEIDKNSLDWVPSRTSFVLQDQGKVSKDGAKAADFTDAAAHGEKIDSLLTKVSTLQPAEKAQASAAVSEEKLDSIISQLSVVQAERSKMDAILNQLETLQQAVTAIQLQQQQQEDN